jgi:hypothetical protein
LEQSAPLRKPLTVDELGTVGPGPVHITDLGVCVHEWVISPCERLRDYTIHHEHRVATGDDQSLRRLKEQLARVEVDLAQSQAALQNGIVGADCWYERHQGEVARLRALVGNTDNSKVIDGPFRPHHQWGIDIQIPCYTCSHFQALLDGPHEAIRSELIAEKQRLAEISGDGALATANDHTILAVAQVIQKCKERRAELQLKATR